MTNGTGAPNDSDIVKKKVRSTKKQVRKDPKRVNNTQKK